MAHFYRLIRALLLCVLFSPLASFADFEKSTQYLYKEGANTLVGPASLDSACSGVADLMASRQTAPQCSYGTAYCTYTPQVTGGACYIKYMPGGFVNGPIPLQTLNGCPKNSTVTADGKCRCEPGYFERSVNGSTQCVKPDDRTPEQLCEDMAMLWNSTLNPDRFARIPGTLSSTYNGITTCFEPGEGSGLPQGKGCKHKFTGDLGFKDDDGKDWVNGHSFAYDKNDKAQVGGSLVCNLADPAPPKQEQPEKCRDGYLGTVNGVEVCVEAVTGETEGIDWTRTTDGEGNHTDEKTNVKCNGDKCTVTTDKTTTKPDGTTTTTTTTTENVNRQGYCARNPEASICGREEDKDGANKGARERGGGNGGGGGDGEGEEENPSQFGGACAAGFTCEGDAILCAIAKDQHKRACDLFDDKTSAEYLLYQSEKEKTGKVTDDLEGNRTVDVAGIVSASDIFLGGAASCPADPTITLHNGMTFVIPYSTLCPYLVTLGNILVIISSMSAVLILIRRI